MENNEDRQKFFRKFFLHKINKNVKKITQGGNVIYIRKNDVITSNSELYNFITSQKMFKTPQNYVKIRSP